MGIFVISSNFDETKADKLKFDLQFKCGTEPASGRLMFYYYESVGTQVGAFILEYPLDFKNFKL